MKLVLVLSVIACGYAAKLDRTYLPPSSAASAGGSPGAITAPGSGFGRGSASAGFGQDLPNGPASKPFEQPASNVPTGQGSNQASSFPEADSRPSLGKPGNQGSNQAGFPGNSFKDNEIGSDASRPSGQFNSQGSRTLFGQTPDFAQEQRAERPQADADRNAEILKYVNENNGDSYEYSYETSNGISAGESGVATDGVMAQGGFSYTGDDGKAYSITYTADENGFQPEGEHLPTPHPIPEEILKSIEENAKAAASGTQEGAYIPEEYESESSPSQQYGNGLQRPQQGPSVTSQRKPDQGNNNYPETSRQQKPSQQPSGNTFDVPRGQRPGGDGYNYNRPTQGQVQSQQPSQAFGNVGNNDISGPASRPNQFNQPQRNQPAEQPKGFTTQYQNQGRPSNQYQQQNGQPQGDNDYNYNKPQATSLESQSSNQENQPQKPFSGFGSNNQELSATPQGPRPSNVNQQRPQFSQNTFGSQPQKYSPSQTGQTQRDNGYTYNQPQGSQNSGPQGLQDSRFPGNQQSNKNVFGQQSSQPSRDFNQAQRPISGSDNAFGRPQVPSNQYTLGPRGQEQIGNGYNYNQPKKSSGPQPGQSQLFSQGVTSQSGPQDGPNQFNQRERPSQGPFSGNQQGPSNKFPSGQRGQDQDENGYYYNRPQNTQSQGPFGQQTQSGAPNQYVFSPRPTAFDSNNQGARPGTMKPSFGQNRPESDTDRQQYSPENRPSFGSTQPDSRPQGSDASRPTEKFQPSLAPASQFRPQQLGQNMPTGQDAPNQSQSRPSSFGESSGNAFTQGQNKPSSFGQSPPNAEQTLAQGYQYGPGQSNQPQRPGSNGQGNGTPGATKGPGSEFGGPRQPPSFSPEEGYKY